MILFVAKYQPALLLATAGVMRVWRVRPTLRYTGLSLLVHTITERLNAERLPGSIMISSSPPDTQLRYRPSLSGVLNQIPLPPYTFLFVFGGKFALSRAPMLYPSLSVSTYEVCSVYVHSMVYEMTPIQSRSTSQCTPWQLVLSPGIIVNIIVLLASCLKFRLPVLNF